MSNLRHQASFSIVMGLDKPPERSPDEWSFIFGPGDMAAMHGSMGRLAEMGGILGLSRALRSDLRDGLLRDEVDQGTFMKRQRKFGINVFPKPPLTPFLELCWNAWHDPIMMLLTFSGFFSLIVRTVESPSHGFVEGLAILLAILTVVLVQAGNNFKQERAFRALDNSKAEEVVKVWRGGVQMRVPESQVYVGDLVELSAGDSVPADGVYIFGDDPAVNEAKMTGESKDIEKNAASPFLLGGTELKRGALFYLATAVGPNSAYGRIMAALAKPPEETPLQEKLAHMATQISKVGAITAAAMFVISMIYWGVDLDKTGDSFRSRGAEIIDFVIISITILVVAVPEGLPLAVTLSLAYSMNKMVEDKCLVRILSACETMGNATAICSDKTGTLTQNKMTVTTGYLSGILYKKIPAVPIWGTDAKDVAQSNIRKLLVQTAVVNSKATQESDQPVAAAAHKEVLMDDAVSLHDREDSTSSVPLVELNGKNGNHDWALNKAGALDLERPGGNSGGAAGKPKQVNGGGAQKPNGGKVAPLTNKNKEEAPEPGKKVWKGNQTEIALMEWLTGWGVDIYRERAHCPVEKNYPFDSMKKNSSVIIRQRVNNQMGFRRCYKGASEQILGLCTHVLDKDENEVPIDQFRAEVNEVIHGMTTTGLRTIGFCYEDHQHIDHDPKDANKLADPPAAEKVVFVGVVGIKDPLRPESRASVRTCQRAGVVVRMVTGDHPETAKFIAQECGILTAPHHEVMTGSDFRLMVENSPDEAERRIPNLRVLARSSPTDKQVLVKWLKDRGHCVAATGDGTNDAPALKEADVGIAMFIAGTTVAKQAASILILDDNFASIVKSVMWGRSIFDNVRKFVQFQLTINVVALTVSLIGALSDYAKPLSAVQLLWVNLIMDSLAALSLGTELPTTKLLDRKPYDRNGPLLSHLMWRNILGHAVFQIALLLMILYKGADIWGVENKGGVHYTLIFNTFVFLQIFNEFNSRQVSPDPEGKLATLFSPYGHLFNNATFWYVFVAMIGMQIMMVELFGSFAQTSPLNPRQWLACVGLGALSMPWGLIVRSIDTDPNQGMVVVPPETFEGANLEVHEENEIGHPNYADYLKRQEEEEAKRAAIAAGGV